MAWQLIYTSAPRLLDVGRTGFGIVARHAEIPQDLAAAVARLSQFSRLPGNDPSRIIYSHRIVPSAGTSAHVLSRIKDAGSDYTGRTNHIAHHFIASPQEIKDLCARGSTPAAAISYLPWLDTWQGSPRHFKEAEQVNLLDYAYAAPVGTWAHYTGDPSYARLPFSTGAAAECFMVLPEGAEAAPLFAEASALDLAGAPEITFVTSLEQGEDLAALRWVALAPSSPERSSLSRYSRPVFDLSQPATLPLPTGQFVGGQAVPAPPSPQLPQPQLHPQPHLQEHDLLAAPKVAIGSADTQRQAAPKPEGRSLLMPLIITVAALTVVLLVAASIPLLGLLRNTVPAGGEEEIVLAGDPEAATPGDGRVPAGEVDQPPSGAVARETEEGQDEGGAPVQPSAPQPEEAPLVAGTPSPLAPMPAEEPQQPGEAQAPAPEEPPAPDLSAAARFYFHIWGDASPIHSEGIPLPGIRDNLEGYTFWLQTDSGPGASVERQALSSNPLTFILPDSDGVDRRVFRIDPPTAPSLPRRLVPEPALTRGGHFWIAAIAPDASTAFAVIAHNGPPGEPIPLAGEQAPTSLMMKEAQGKRPDSVTIADIVEGWAEFHEGLTGEWGERLNGDKKWIFLLQSERDPSTQFDVTSAASRGSIKRTNLSPEEDAELKKWIAEQQSKIQAMGRYNREDINTKIEDANSNITDQTADLMLYRENKKKGINGQDHLIEQANNEIARIKKEELEPQEENKKKIDGLAEEVASLTQNIERLQYLSLTPGDFLLLARPKDSTPDFTLLLGRISLQPPASQ